MIRREYLSKARSGVSIFDAKTELASASMNIKDRSRCGMCSLTSRASLSVHPAQYVARFFKPPRRALSGLPLLFRAGESGGYVTITDYVGALVGKSRARRLEIISASTSV